MVDSPRSQRRPGRQPSGKKLTGRDLSGKLRTAYRRSIDPCENSNDSGLGFDHHADSHQHTMTMSERVAWNGERVEAKRPRLDIKVENEEVNDNYCFPDSVLQSKENNVALIRTTPGGSVPALVISNNTSHSSSRTVQRCTPAVSRQTPSSPISLTTQLTYTSRFSDVVLTIIKQPEQQHRARYQTEGSRGAVKDIEGNGFPIVQLTGYYKPAVLQVYIGTDIGKVSPHMFYQACKVSGKNSTPCVEKKIEGTCVIELALDPAKDMCANCDCVGILKVAQPPGIPEICKKSLTSCPASGGLELFVLGKNFLKDTKVIFQQFEEGRVCWEQSVVPDKEYLQQGSVIREDTCFC
ncbi:hypothetical protein YQE_08591, partial [Dendroctonus ponderosae]